MCKGLLLGEFNTEEALSVLNEYYICSNHSLSQLRKWSELHYELKSVNAGYGHIYNYDFNESNKNEYIKKAAVQYLAKLEIPLPETLDE